MGLWGIFSWLRVPIGVAWKTPHLGARSMRGRPVRPIGFGVSVVRFDVRSAYQNVVEKSSSGYFTHYPASESTSLAPQCTPASLPASSAMGSMAPGGAEEAEVGPICPIEAALLAAGFKLPKPSTPAANYVPYVLSHDSRTVFVSGQIPKREDGSFAATGQVGSELCSVEQAQEAAQICALNILAQVREAIRSRWPAGDLRKVVK